MEMSAEIFVKFAIAPPYNYLSESKERWQNLSGQLRGYCLLMMKEVRRNSINVANEGLFWKISILLIDMSK